MQPTIDTSFAKIPSVLSEDEAKAEAKNEEKRLAERELTREHCAAYESPFVDWVTYDHPWDYLERRTKHHMWKNQGVRDYKRNHLIKEAPAHEFEELPMNTMLSLFFRSNGKPNQMIMLKNVDQWIVWAVTQGRYCMDKNKNTYVYRGNTDLFDPDAILFLKDSSGYWDCVPQENGFPILGAITEAANRLCEAVLRKLTRVEPRNIGVRTIQNNLSTLPEFVMFQSYRSHMHKNYLWNHGPPGKRGGKRGPVARPLREPKHSVQRILRNYHLWLPSMK
jgi:hypothetical protein